MRIAISLLLQGALGGAFLVILVLVLIGVVVVLAAIFGGALEDRTGNGEASQSIIPPGTMLAATGLGLAVLGAFYASTGFNFLGIIVGAIAYYRGAQVLGVLACVLSLVTIFIGYYLGTGAFQFDL